MSSAAHDSILIPVWQKLVLEGCIGNREIMAKSGKYIRLGWWSGNSAVKSGNSSLSVFHPYTHCAVKIELGNQVHQIFVVMIDWVAARLVCCIGDQFFFGWGVEA